MGNSLQSAANKADEDPTSLTGADIMNPIMSMMVQLQESGVFDGIEDDDGEQYELNADNIQEHFTNLADDAELNQPISQIGGDVDMQDVLTQMASGMSEMSEETLGKIMGAVGAAFAQPGFQESMKSVVSAVSTHHVHTFYQQKIEDGMTDEEFRKRVALFRIRRDLFIEDNLDWDVWRVRVIMSDPNRFESELGDIPLGEFIDMIYGLEDYEDIKDTLPKEPEHAFKRPGYQKQLWDEVWSGPTPEDIEPVELTRDMMLELCDLACNS